MIEKLMELEGGKFLIPVVVIVAVAAVVKGMFGIHLSRSSDRRDFLELFQKYQGENDLWLSVAVRHLFGAYLPATLIRQLMRNPQPGRALLEVADAWDLLDMANESGELHWRRRRFASPAFRRVLGWVLLASYFVLAGLALVLGYLNVVVGFDEIGPTVVWIYVLFMTLGAFWCLTYQENLKNAGKAAQRWLGLP
jgi:hypothetical protein